MTDGEGIIVLDEFRLHDVDADGSAARMVAGASRSSRDPPLLTSIADPRDVAVLRTVAAGSPEPDDLREHAGLGSLVAGWQGSKHYRSRIAATAETSYPVTFRLAVTESGINDEATPPPGEWFEEATSAEPVATLLIGIPVGTHAGLLVLVGRAGSSLVAQASADWPRSLSRELGVRVYRG